MKLKKEDREILKELCEKYDISFAKILKLMDTEKEFELKGHNNGLNSALKEIIKSKYEEDEL